MKQITVTFNAKELFYLGELVDAACPEYSGYDAVEFHLNMEEQGISKAMIDTVYGKILDAEKRLHSESTSEDKIPLLQAKGTAEECRQKITNVLNELVASFDKK